MNVLGLQSSQPRTLPAVEPLHSPLIKHTTSLPIPLTTLNPKTLPRRPLRHRWIIHHIKALPHLPIIRHARRIPTIRVEIHLGLATRFRGQRAQRPRADAGEYAGEDLRVAGTVALADGDVVDCGDWRGGVAVVETAWEGEDMDLSRVGEPEGRNRQHPVPRWSCGLSMVPSFTYPRYLMER